MTFSFQNLKGLQMAILGNNQTNPGHAMDHSQLAIGIRREPVPLKLVAEFVQPRGIIPFISVEAEFSYIGDPRAGSASFNLIEVKSSITVLPS